jgi:hypothetical protein
VIVRQQNPDTAHTLTAAVAGASGNNADTVVPEPRAEST